MGRKVHPVGFRLKYIRDWNTRWYAEKQQYQDLLHEDFAIRAMIRKEMPQAGISALNIERAAPNQVQVTIHTAKPGIVIGRKGASVKELRGKLRQLTDKAVKLEVEEISQPDTDAQLIAENVANQMERRISHSRAMKRAVQQAMRQGAEGVRIEVGGRLGGSEMARKEKVWDGRVPRNTIRADLDYGFAEALTTFGKIGVKVWIYRGEILPQKAESAMDVYISE
ncbi:MAG: 30S ribosomal protein S3 [Chloroflexi bacterium]|nr:30S ribosomal protein S3 [Chloroflexota bacterium]MBK6710363.1 30S ribosomal protein S3 [Chloroflexota bacterium]MBK7180072.1 30S ribosomal protein S3 [Chloroflexota bacterium]MBK7917713.1 30S ribosomal protein S3 [Chloroflexota bacterium]MBK8934775.1 30S ribosomal protein S3 [Chloroflexota bacterium]